MQFVLDLSAGIMCIQGLILIIYMEVNYYSTVPELYGFKVEYYVVFRWDIYTMHGIINLTKEACNVYGQLKCSCTFSP